MEMYMENFANDPSSAAILEDIQIAADDLENSLNTIAVMAADGFGDDGDDLRLTGNTLAGLMHLLSQVAHMIGARAEYGINVARRELKEAAMP